MIAAASWAARSGTTWSFGPVRQLKAGVLDVGYVEAGPAGGRPVILLHGFPYDIHSFVEVAPLLAAEGYRVIVPYMRGHGTTTFLSPTTPRTGEQAATATDVLALTVGRHHRGVVANRCKALVSVTGYLIANLAANKLPATPNVERAFWYQYYFSTERGVLGLTEYRHNLGELIWKFNSPTWHFSQATYDQTAAAFNKVRSSRCPQ